MADIVRERPKEDYIQDDSCPASEDLTALNFCWVAAGGGAAGAMTVGAPGGQGVPVYGVLLNDPDEDETAALKIKGIAECKALEAINAGVECTVADATGRIEAAASGDFVCCITREAATGENHLVSVNIVHYYYP